MDRHSTLPYCTYVVWVADVCPILVTDFVQHDNPLLATIPNSRMEKLGHTFPTHLRGSIFSLLWAIRINDFLVEPLAMSYSTRGVWRVFAILSKAAHVS